MPKRLTKEQVAHLIQEAVAKKIVAGISITPDDWFKFASLVEEAVIELNIVQATPEQTQIFNAGREFEAARQAAIRAMPVPDGLTLPMNS